MFNRTLKIAAIATVAVVATASASFAAGYAFVDHDAKVRAFHSNGSAVVNWVAEGQKVKVLNTWGNWVKVKIPGQDGWVKANALDFHSGPYFPHDVDYDYGYGGYGGYGGGSFCVAGSHASFCLGASY
jgi:uncharacterized protein YraI